MKIALLADIHANLEALEKVLEDIEKKKISDIISLGDNVGYGPNPVEVLKKLYEKKILSLEGNHDFAVVNRESFDEASDVAVGALSWTRKQLVEAVNRESDFEQVLENYIGTPATYILPEDPRILLVHGCPGINQLRFEYLLEAQDMVKPAQYMAKKGLKITFFGHTHRQVLWEVDPSGVSVIDFTANEPLVFTENELKGSQLLINPGSVGQPRDRNPKAAYLIYERKEDQHILTFARVAYEVKKTAQKIYDIEELDPRLGDRLIIGA